MAHKIFQRVMTIVFSISFLTACAGPSDVFPTSPFINVQQVDTNTTSQSTGDQAGVTTRILGQPALALGQERAAKNIVHDPNFGQLPLYFVENTGQTDPNVAFYVLGGTT